MKHRLPPLDEMERIEKENIGFVITDGGLDKVVIIPFRWFAENFPDEVPEVLK